ncbi:MAG: putative lipase [Deltaproteobacteria bacterium]|nr:putative lipase [Deltaproteobacteria bacterium]
MRRKLFPLPVFLLLFSLLSSCVHEGAAQKVTSDRPLHIVFLVHGLAGTLQDFGQMRGSLLKHLPEENDHFEWRVRSFEYDTPNNSKGVGLFSKQLATFIETSFGALRPNGLHDDDKFSLVAHSQGGLVSTTLLYNLAAGSSELDAKYQKHVDALITLATPFWGAKTATFGLPIDDALNSVVDVLPGERQMSDMSFGSEAIHNFRRAAISLSDHQHPFPARVLNLIGYLKGAKIAAAFSEGQQEFENDIAVPLSSGRLDFLYAEDLQKSYAPFATTSRFQETHFGKYTVVDAVHFSVSEVNSVVWVTSDCLDDKRCDHPTYAYVLKHLAERHNPLEKADLKKMTAFLLELEVQVPPGIVFDDDELDIRFTSAEENIEIARLLEPYSKHSSSIESTKGMHRFVFSGTANKSWDDDEKRFKSRVLSFSVFAKKNEAATGKSPGSPHVDYVCQP